MNNTPLISVVMPAYNMELYISDSIRSVLNQDYQNWELIVIDDGSTDSTADIVKEFVATDERIKFYYQENTGQAIARNQALENASGDLIAFLDSDDIWLPQKLSISVKEFLSSNQDLLFTDAYVFYDLKDLDETSNLSIMHVQCATYEGYGGVAEFLRGNKVPMLTVLAKRSVLLKSGGFPSIKIAEDYYLWMKLLQNNYRLRGINIPLSAYRVREDSLMHESENEIVEVLNMFVLFFNDNSHIDTKCKKSLKHWLRMFVKQHLTKNNIDLLKQYFISFQLYAFPEKIIFSLNKALPLSSRNI